MKQLRNQNGTLAFEIALVVLVVVAISSAGYFSYVARSENATATQAADLARPLK